MRRDKLERSGVAVETKLRDDFSIRMSRGRLLQVVDNLERNSEYWLRRHARTHSHFKPRITLEIDEPNVLFWDNGPGVSENVENTLFDMFITEKPRAEGQGLGLYIATQLLAREGCSIRLLPKRNASGRRYVFEIDLSGALHGG